MVLKAQNVTTQHNYLLTLEGLVIFFQVILETY